MSLVIDNAIWDDAVRKVYPPTLDTTWLYNTWGAGYKINNLYDGTFVLDENYRVLWGSFHSKPFDEKNLSFFGEGLQYYAHPGRDRFYRNRVDSADDRSAGGL